MLSRIFKKNKKKNLILALWFFNPVNIYAFYIFSRHDSFTLLALLLTTFFLAKDKILGAVLSFFAAIQIRFQPIFYLPLYFIHVFRNFKINPKFTKKLLIALAIILAVIFLEKQLPFDNQSLDQLKGIIPTKIVSKDRAPSRLLELISKPFYYLSKDNTSYRQAFFLLTYIFLSLSYFFIKKSKNFKEAFLNLNLISYIALAIYFVINDFSPHYFVWLSGFATISVVINKKFLPGYLLSILGWGIMGIFSTDNFAITQNLFLPISPLIFNTPQIGYVVQNSPKLFILGRIILNIGLLWSGFIAAKYVFRDMYSFKDWKKVFKIGLVILASMMWIAPNKVEAAKIPIIKLETNEKVFLEPGVTYQNEFTVNNNEFGSLDLKFDTGRSGKDHELLFRLKEINSEDWYYQAKYNTADFYNNAFYPFGFPTINNSLNKTYLFEVEVLNKPDLPFAIYHDSYVVSKDGDIRELKKQIGNDLTNKWNNQKTFFVFWLSLLSFNLLALLAVSLKKWDNQK